jgi:hypothetical protein
MTKGYLSPLILRTAQHELIPAQTLCSMIALLNCLKAGCQIRFAALFSQFKNAFGVFE